MDRVFVDAGAFVALLSPTDGLHVRAENIYRDLVARKIMLVTTNHVIDETCTWILRKMGHSATMRLHDFLKCNSVSVSLSEMLTEPPAGNRLIIVYSTPEIEQDAWRILAKYDTAGFSFTDCTSFAVMSILSIRAAFTFDSHFEIQGFERL